LRRIGRDTQRFEIGNGLNGHDLLAPNQIDQKIACASEQKLFGVVGNVFTRALENADIDFLPQIDEVARISPIVPQVSHQDCFERQNLANHPG
jgi:hypothetical protein